MNSSGKARKKLAILDFMLIPASLALSLKFLCFLMNAPTRHEDFGLGGLFCAPFYSAMAWNFKALPNDVQKTINLLRFDGTPSAKALNAYQITGDCQWPCVFVEAISKSNCLYKRRVAMPRPTPPTVCRCDGDHYCLICKHDPHRVRTRTTRDRWILPRSYLSAHECKVLLGRT